MQTEELQKEQRRSATPTKQDEPEGLTLKHNNNSNKIISGLKKEYIEFLIRLTTGNIVLRNYKNPLKWFKILRTLDRHRREFSGDNRIKKVARVDGKYFWDLYIPGWPSAAFNQFFEAEINRIAPRETHTNRFSNIYVAITKKCSLQCEHCYEWDALNGKETLRPGGIKEIILALQKKGTAQLQLSGGEPMLRVDDITDILSTAKKDTEFWVLTSGLNLTHENANKLKKSGLTGVMVSLDHFNPALHNLFRGYKKSYEWVEKSVENAVANKLVVTLTLCATKSFVTEANLLTYAELAKKWGVSFIQILEPRAVGHYRGEDVSLSSAQEKLLENFFWKMNYYNKYKDYPIVSYHGYYQRRMGCFGAGSRSLYIDTDGDIHACPFCQNKMGNVLSDNLDASIQKLQTAGCHAFKSADF